MATKWGSYSAHARCGVSATISPANPSHSDTSVKVTWRYYVGTDGWGFQDNQTLHYSSTSWSGGSSDYYCTGFSSKLIATHSINYSINYGSKRSVTANANITGMYNGGSPSVSYTIDLPARPYAAPSNGENPQATNVGSTDVTITWGPPTDPGGASVDQYQLQIADNSGFTSPDWNHTFAGIGNGSDHATGLRPGTHYYARVRAHNVAGWGDWTSATGCQFTTTGGTPTVPSRLNVSAYDQTSVNLAWRASNGNGAAVTYRAQCSTSSSFTSPTERTGSALGTAFGSLTANTTYYFRVRAENSFGNSAWSGTVSQKTKAVPVYNDTGTFVQRMGNFAGATADKLVHLGCSLMRAKTGVTTFTENSTTVLNMGAFVFSHGKDAPTYTGSGTSDFTINYPGTYTIELAISFNEGIAPAAAGYIGLSIYVNGNNRMTSSDQKGGIYKKDPQPNGSATAAMRSVSITRYLDVGDTVGWSVFMNANNGGTPVTSQDNGGGIQCYGRVTMTGF